MLKRSLRTRTLNAPGVSDAEVQDAIEALLKGSKPRELPTHLCKSVISQLTQMRKDALLQKRDALAAKMDDILGELQYGPQKYVYQTIEEPNLTRSRTIVSASADTNRLKQTGKTLVGGARFESVDSPSRQAVTPILKTKRVKQLSKANYEKSRNLDRTVDGICEYELDSRRIAPRLQKVEALQKKLDDARAELEHYKQRAKQERLRYEALEKAAEEDLDERLAMDMLDYGAHAPTSLPLEFSKFSGKVLDMRVRERKSAGIRKYDDAAALRTEAVKKEKEELQALSERFIRSYQLQKQEVLRKQGLKKAAFKELWIRKSEKNQREIAAKMRELKVAVTNLEREVADAQMSAGAELTRIRNNERLVNTPTAGKQAASPHRF